MYQRGEQYKKLHINWRRSQTTMDITKTVHFARIIENPSEKMWRRLPTGNNTEGLAGILVLYISQPSPFIVHMSKAKEAYVLSDISLCFHRKCVLQSDETKLDVLGNISKKHVWDKINTEHHLKNMVVEYW